MKKYLILLIIPLLFFSTGCEEDVVEIIGYNCSPISGNCVESNDGFYLNLEDCENECGEITEEPQLDSNLFGNWFNPNGPGGYEYIMTLSPNGNFVWDGSYNGNDGPNYSGIWWVEGNYLVLSGDYSKSHPYVISETTLDYDWIWTQQD